MLKYLEVNRLLIVSNKHTVNFSSIEEIFYEMHLKNSACQEIKFKIEKQ